MNPGCHRLLIGPAGTILCAARGICRALGALVLFACAAQASDWPTRLITAVVPYAAGGNTDTMARMVGERLTAALGQPVVVENVAGASGAIGAARQRHVEHHHHEREGGEQRQQRHEARVQPPPQAPQRHRPEGRGRDVERGAARRAEIAVRDVHT